LTGSAILAAGVSLFLGVIDTPLFGDGEARGEAYRFVCENEGAGRSAVDVLLATGNHTTFLDLFSWYDPEGFAFLSDAELADKTVYAPTDAAFLAVGGDLSTMSPEEIAAILGYHVSPPRRAPGDHIQL
jgi:uncharacterized surface protein with fasciclin (FAS1) repeats